jgi:large subunit ribosomal protein L16
MLLQPKKRKFRKDRKGAVGLNNNGQPILARSHRLKFGSYGLKTLETSLLKASHLETIRRVMIRDLRRIGQI